ncbi:MAG: hypothetical protein ACFB10_14940 [Salibacteraceae bacterium]
MKDKKKLSIKAMAEKAEAVSTTQKMTAMVGGRGTSVTHDIIVWPM